jgi:hypothetical protein
MLPTLLCGCGAISATLLKMAGFVVASIVVAYLIKWLPIYLAAWRQRRREAKEARIRMWEKAYARQAQRMSESSPFRRDL